MSIIFYLLFTSIVVFLIIFLIGIIPYTFHIIVKFSIGQDKRKIIKWKNRREKLLEFIGIKRHRKVKINYEALKQEATDVYWKLRNMPAIDEKVVSQFLYEEFEKIASYYFQKGKNTATYKTQNDIS